MCGVLGAPGAWALRPRGVGGRVQQVQGDGGGLAVGEPLLRQAPEGDEVGERGTGRVEGGRGEFWREGWAVR
ncbi:hypothetical protein B1218_32465 [Pseudomonas ogarae]|nr:hypothetical protein B1218_32465 [Pseudomonas ogarae]